MLAIFLNVVLIIGVRSVVFSQPVDAPVQDVRSINLVRIGADRATGLLYDAGKARFYTLNGARLASFDAFEDAGPTFPLEFPADLLTYPTYSGASGRLLGLDSSGSLLTEVLLDSQAQITAQWDIPANGLTPGGLAADPDSGRVYILNRNGPALVHWDPPLQSGEDQAEPVETPLTDLDGADMAGLAFDPQTGLLTSYSREDAILYTFTASGRLISRRDLSYLALNDVAGLVFSPSGDSTDAPDETSLYLLETARSRVVEVSFDELVLPPASRLPEIPIWVQTIDTSIASWNPSSPDPAGVDYHPGLGRLVIGDSEVEEMPNYYQGKNVFLSTLTGTQADNCDTTTFSSEPTGVAVNPITNQILFSDDNADEIFFVDFGPDGNYCTGDDVLTSLDTRWFGSDDPEGVGFGAGLLFVSDGLDQEVYVIDPGPNGVFDGGPPGDDSVTHFDTFSLGFNDPEGIDFSEDTGNVFIVNRNNNRMAEVTVNGTLVTLWDISSLNAVSPAGIGLGPGSQDPGETTVYISQRGVDNGADPNENDGKVFEVSIGLNSTPPTATPSSTPTNTPDPNVTSTPIPPPTFTPTVDPNPQSIAVQVSTSSDDVEEAPNGVMDINSSDLELVYSGGSQVVGMRFNNVAIPAGAVVTNAYVQFTVDEVTTGAVNLNVEGELSPDASPFTTATGNLSTRPRTVGSVPWSPPDWNTVGEAGPDQQTPNLSDILQQIVDQGAWSPGNSVVIVVSGTTNKRTAESYDGSTSGAPVLHVVYSLDSATATPTPTFTPLPPTATFTPLPPTATFTFTPVPPTPTATFTPLPPTATFTPLPPTATFTPLPPTATFTPLPPSPTPTATFTPEPPTATPTPTNTSLPPTATPTPRPNLALNRPVTASSQDPGFGPGRAVDGSLLSAWNTEKATGNIRLNTEWLQVDLGAEYPVNQVVLSWDIQYATVYSIRVSTDGAVWNTVFLTSLGDGGQDVINFSTVTARYVRFESSDWSNSVWRNWLFEFEVFGGAPVPTPTNTPGPTPTFTPSATFTPTPTNTPEPITGYHIADLESSAVDAGNTWSASVSVLVHDSNHLPLVGALVTGAWSENPGVSVSCTTNADGRCTLNSPSYPRNVKIVVFSVTNVTHPSGTYNPANNHDLDGDSNGTSIEALRP